MRHTSFDVRVGPQQEASPAWLQHTAVMPTGFPLSSGVGGSIRLAKYPEVLVKRFDYRDKYQFDRILLHTCCGVGVMGAGSILCPLCQRGTGERKVPTRKQVEELVAEENILGKRSLAGIVVSFRLQEIGP